MVFKVIERSVSFKYVVFQVKSHPKNEELIQRSSNISTTNKNEQTRKKIENEERVDDDVMLFFWS